MRSLLLEHDAEKHRADDLHIENLRLRVELDRYKKWYYGPRADRLQTTGDLAQMLLGFAEALDQKPYNPVIFRRIRSRAKNCGALVGARAAGIWRTSKTCRSRRISTN